MTSLNKQIEAYDVVDAPEDADLHTIAAVAAQICGASSAMVNLLDDNRQHTIATQNFARGVASRSDSMCATTLQLAEPVHVVDAREDPRFSDNPFVTGELGHIRFYAASLLRTPEGAIVGTLCVSDETPRELDEGQRAALDGLAAQVVQVLRLRARSRELAQSNAELVRSNADLGAFAGRVAHDLRNPIAATKGFLSLACGPFGTELTGRARECVEHASAANDRMGQLVEALLSYAAAGARTRTERVHLEDLVAAVAIDVRALLAGTVGRIETGRLPTVDGDPTLLRQLLQNFITNALKYSRPGVPPIVRVEAETTAAGWSLSVSDNGRGIPLAEQAEVFELFSRLPGGRDVPGSGIGLATCARIAEALGGHITVSSNDAGGTTFALSVDRAD